MNNGPSQPNRSEKKTNGLVAFTGFAFRPDNQGHAQGDTQGDTIDGLIKITAHQPTATTGVLSLTFIVETEQQQATKDFLNRCLRYINYEALKPYMSEEIIHLEHVPKDFATHVQDWYFEEVRLHIDEPFAREKQVFLIQRMMAAIETILPFSIQALEWWPEQEALLEEQTSDSVWAHYSKSISALWQKWFKSG